ncbi:MAG: glycosyltransferase [Tannerellaceae bacterium]|jgi:glycosyltransferase involved in cell wall biosynthesis|nr:glycosyltransferase [Tannerellaceae bacterium]
MKVVFLSTSERNGGAAIAAGRLMQALLQSGVEVKMLVRDKQTSGDSIVSINTSRLRRLINFLRFAHERWIIYVHNRFSRKGLFAVSIANVGADVSQHPLVKSADIIHLHWINQGFLSLESIRRLIATGKPTIWTMHDMWPFTGACHIVSPPSSVSKRDYEHCLAYMDKCGDCPLLLRPASQDLSRRTWMKKRTSNFASQIHFVAVSSWLRAKAKESSLMHDATIDIIPNTIDTTLFHPSDKIAARKRLSFPLDKKIIAMGAAKLNDPLKGFNFLREALSRLDTPKPDDCLLVLFGGIKDAPAFLDDIPIPHKWLGIISSSQAAQVYAAADVTVSTSLFETFGQTLIEAMACGCPVVSFNNSGQTDIIDHKINGYLAKYKDVADLARGIRRTLYESDYAELSKNAVRKVADCYSQEAVAQQYINLYKTITDRKKRENHVDIKQYDKQNQYT